MHDPKIDPEAHARICREVSELTDSELVWALASTAEPYDSLPVMTGRPSDTDIRSPKLQWRWSPTVGWQPVLNLKTYAIGILSTYPPHDIQINSDGTATITDDKASVTVVGNPDRVVCQCILASLRYGRHLAARSAKRGTN